MFRNYSHIVFFHIVPYFCSQWLPGVWNPVSSLEMLFSAATLSCCLFVGLCAFSFVFRNSNVFSVALRSRIWLVYLEISNFFVLKNSWFAFAVCCWLLAICAVNLLNLSREYGSVYFRIHAATSVGRHNITAGSLACPQHNTASNMFDR